MTKEHHAPIMCNVLFCPWDYLGKNTGAGLSFPPPRDLPYRGNQSRSLASCLSRWVLYHQSPQGSPHCNFNIILISLVTGLLQWLSGKESTCNEKLRKVSICGSGKIPWRRKWQTRSSTLAKNTMESGAWWAIVKGVTKSWT